MDSADPVEAKRVLNLLHGAPGQECWEEERHDILLSGLLAKFRQNNELRKYLLSSEDRQLGEASRNRVWGIGLTLADKERLNTKLWNGGNLLGKTLMEVRQALVDDQNHQGRRSEQNPRDSQDSPAGDSTSNQDVNEQPDQIAPALEPDQIALACDQIAPALQPDQIAPTPDASTQANNTLPLDSHTQVEIPNGSHSEAED